MTTIPVIIGPLQFTAQMEEADAPKTCRFIRQLLPLQANAVQALWCGEAIWIPLNNQAAILPRENETTMPNRGEILFYSDQSGKSGLLFSYGSACFTSSVGNLRGNHCLTIVSGENYFQELGNKILWEGAQSVFFDLENIDV
jgi:hypothetical protein